MKTTIKSLFFLSLLFVSCTAKTPTTQQDCTVQHLDWTRDAVIYEVNVRQYTPEGTFAAFQQYLPQLKELGVDVLWFMPIHRISETNRKGTLGSYYSIDDYKSINPEFGTHNDFKILVEEAHKAGFKVIIDWVANHTGWDNHWYKNNPEWYAVDSLGNHYSPYDWTDVAQLDFTNTDMRDAMLDAMKYWVSDFNIDGFRCDFAGDVPTDFWENARVELDKIKPVFMLAESEKSELLNHAFDADYAWEFMHIMNEIAKGNKNANHIDEYLQKIDTLICHDAYKLNLITNHDENSWNGTEYERLGAGVEAFAVLTYTLNGIPLIYTGQEIGLKKRLEFFEKDAIPSFEKNKTFEFYQRLNHLKHQYKVLSAGIAGGKVERINTNADDKVFCFERANKNEDIVVVLNLSNEDVAIEFSDYTLSGNYVDYFKNTENATITQSLQPWEYQVLIKSNK